MALRRCNLIALFALRTSLRLEIGTTEPTERASSFLSVRRPTRGKGPGAEQIGEQTLRQRTQACTPEIYTTELRSERSESERVILRVIVDCRPFKLQPKNLLDSV